MTPALVIELEIEAAPKVRLRAMNDAEEARIVDWIRAHDELAELIARAIEIAEEAAA